MDKSQITMERKDEIIEGFLEEYMCGITEDGMEVLQNIMEPEEIEAYGYDTSEIE